jgi:site-specific DNA-methyltransferase (adenine-specific)
MTYCIRNGLHNKCCTLLIGGYNCAPLAEVVVQNTLFCGDNLQILREYLPSDSVDLVYLDPPFNSDQNYNLLFREKDGSRSASQILAFEDTWEWNQEAQANYEAITNESGKLSQAMTQFRTLLGETDMLAYLAMMAPRLVELRRVLKETGSLYLHCDPTAAHYLKVLLDAIFGPQYFRNEITWKRTNTHSDAKRWSPVSDTLLYYAKGDKTTWNPPWQPHSDEHIASKYRQKDDVGRPYTLSDMTSPKPRPNMMYDWKGFTSPALGWRYSRETMSRLDAEGRIWYPEDKSKRPRLKRYLHEMSGTLIGNVWTDIPPLNSQALERKRIGYPTQKPQALLERIIAASSNPDDIVLDPFCGCGTAIEAAHKLQRRWIGIDITRLAIGVVKDRLSRISRTFDQRYATIYEPLDVSGAEALAAEDPHQFQDWFVRKLGGVSRHHRRGADRGVDGRLYFKDDATGPLRQIIVSVKSGKINPAYMREVHGTMHRERAAMGILAVLRQPSKAMLRDAASSGMLTCLAGTYPKTQIITVDQLFSKTPLNLPPLQRMTERRTSVAAIPETQMDLPGIAG